MHRSKQNKPCPNSECAFPTLNRQSSLSDKIKNIIHETDAAVLDDANVCSFCGCVYSGDKKHKTILGYWTRDGWYPEQ